MVVKATIPRVIYEAAKHLPDRERCEFYDCLMRCIFDERFTIGMIESKLAKALTVLAREMDIEVVEAEDD